MFTPESTNNGIIRWLLWLVEGIQILQRHCIRPLIINILLFLEWQHQLK
jgi:hypothetical protein